MVPVGWFEFGLYVLVDDVIPYFPSILVDDCVLDPLPKISRA